MDAIKNLKDSQQKNINKIEMEILSTVKSEDLYGFDSKISSYKHV